MLSISYACIPSLAVAAVMMDRLSVDYRGGRPYGGGMMPLPEAPSSSPRTLGDNLIPVVNKLQDIFNQVTVDLKLQLPQVAVIGSQSSGKSSVLESLVGRDFLPRGSDIVTRRPLVLQLVKTAPSSSGKPAEYGEFLHAPGKPFYDFDRIRQEIMNETDRVVGSNKNVSDKPIRLKIFSPHVLTMTLVDLPGMTKVPVGDQPTDIEQRIRQMVLEYIQQPNCIILAVSPANADLANSDALHMAQMVDPEGVRTIGVLTKIDIMDRGTNCMHILRNQLIPLRLGYVAVVNRSQEDINHNTNIADARKAEESFFMSRPEYRDVVQQCGIANLARRLNIILVDHIRQLLPGLRRRINEALEARALELRALGDPQPLRSKSARGAYLLQMLCEYSDRFAAMLEGRHHDLSTSQLSGGARIRYVFNDVFGKGVKDLAPMRDIPDDEISTVIKNGAGITGNLLVPQEPFELLVRKALLQLLPPSLQCKEYVYEELLRIAEQAGPKELARFPKLQRHLASAVLDFIKAGADPAEAMIRNLVECEHDYINCDNPEFIGGRGAIRAVMQDRSVRAAQAKAREQPAENGKEGASRSKPSSSTSDTKPNGLALALVHSTPVGLKGIPEPSPHINDELISRTRRRSDDGDIAAASSSTSGSTWFSWFGRTDLSRSETRASDDLLLNRSRLQAAPGRLRSEQDEVEVEVIRKLVDSYFCIVRKTLLDQVPKAIMHFMVNNTKRGLQQHLIQQLYRDDMFEELLSERNDVVAQREACQEALSVLQAAAKALEEVPGELSSMSLPGGPVAQDPVGPASFRMPIDRHPSMRHAAHAAAVAVGTLYGGADLRHLEPVS